MQIDRRLCDGCQECSSACPARAMRAVGERRDMAGLLAEAESDRPWYEATGGGVTLSGGEPCAQPEFAAAFLAACGERGLHTALDTCGQVSPEAFARVLEHANLVLFDLKHADESAHCLLTGAGLSTIHTNLREAARRARAGGLKLWIRTPLIPGAAAETTVLHSIGAFLRGEFSEVIGRWELCAFNPSCSVKYGRLGLPWPYEKQRLLSEDRTAALLAAAREACGDDSLVCLHGMRRGHDSQYPASIKPC